jgi:hypothetical protein
MSNEVAATRLQIAPVIERARTLAAAVSAELPTHDGLGGAAAMLVAAAAEAERVTARQRRPWSLHRLPVVFLGVTLASVAGYAYWQLVHVSTLTLALPDRDAVQLRTSIEANRLSVKPVEVPGSREAVELLGRGEVDLGFVQGGVGIPPELDRLEAPQRELVLFLLRPGLEGPQQVRTVLTSVKGEGSHAVAQAFFGAWGREVRYLHEWKALTADPAYRVPAEVDAVLVSKDLGDERALLAVERLAAQGFRLASPQLGARASRFDWLRPAELPAGYVQTDPAIPAAAVATYSVATYLVARQGLTPRLLAQAASVLDAQPRSITDHRFKLTSGEAAGLFQGLDAALSILVNVGLAFLALLGLDVVAYRRKFHELNSLVSVISLLQSSKDVLDAAPAERGEQLRYLGLCSDMLSLISAIAGYYTQENSSLLFNNLSEVVHQRCDGLKLNIQLKLLHALGTPRGLVPGP